MPRIPEPAADKSLDDAAFAGYTLDMWQQQDLFYSFWIERWRRTIDFLRSMHWNILREVNPDTLPAWRRFPVINMTLALYNDYLTQWLQSKVRFSAVPDLPDSKSIGQAELCDQLLRSLWDKLELDTKRVDLGSWLLATGNGHLRIFWDTNTGEMIPLGVPDGQGGVIPVNPKTLQPDPSMQEPIMVDAGEIGVEVISPQLVRWATNKAHGCMVGYMLSYDEAYNRYGKETAEELQYGKVMGALASDLLSISTPGSRTMLDEGALVIEHYLPKSSRYPKGLWWTSSARRMIVKPTALPSQFIPIVPFRWVPLTGHPTMGLTPLYDVTFLNKNIDELMAKSMEWLNKVVPKALLLSGGGLKQGDLTEEPFQELTVNAGGEPAFPTIPPPPEIFQHLREELVDTTLLIGGYKLRRAKELPPGEASQRFRQPPKMQNEGEQVALAHINSSPSWKKVGYILLDYVARFYEENRTLSTVGADRIYQWRDFKGSDLSNLTATLHVDELPLYPWNRQSMRDNVIAVLGSPGAQVLFQGADGQLDRERVDAALEATGLDVASSTLDPDIAEARNENCMFRNLQDPQQAPGVQAWQNHEQHVYEHKKELKTVSFRSWAEPAQQAFLEHVGGHEQALQQAAQAQQQQMLGQEQSLREIRAQAETSQDVRTALGEKLVELLFLGLAKSSNLTDEKPKATIKPKK